jgi:hypothetical protein
MHGHMTVRAQSHRCHGTCGRTFATTTGQASPVIRPHITRRTRRYERILNTFVADKRESIGACLGTGWCRHRPRFCPVRWCTPGFLGQGRPNIPECSVHRSPNQEEPGCDRQDTRVRAVHRRHHIPPLRIRIMITITMSHCVSVIVLSPLFRQ